MGHDRMVSGAETEYILQNNEEYIMFAKKNN